ncbi:MAG: hypothetical protein LBT80_08390 [Lactobacillaceae bacterium]|jgi:hypothetical protein|nr:hypothetical protein [Lactobacillaceae bacterium]
MHKLNKKIIRVTSAALICLPGVLAIPTAVLAAPVPNTIKITDENGKNIADKDVQIPFFENTKGMSKKVGSDGMKLIKPGATGDYTFQVTSKAKYSFDFSFNDQNLKNIPLDYRIKVGASDYILGSSQAYEPYKEGAREFTWGSKEIAGGVKTNVTIEWQWEDNEKYAAYSQSLAENSTLNASDIDPSIQVTAQQEDNDGSGGGDTPVNPDKPVTPDTPDAPDAPVTPNTPADGGNIINNIVNVVTDGITTLGTAIGNVLGINPSTTDNAATSSASSSSSEIDGDAVTVEDNDTSSAAQKQEQQDSTWPWLLGVLGAAALAGLGWFLFGTKYRNRNLIKELSVDDNNVMHYVAAGKTPLGYFDKYFGVTIPDFEQAKKSTLLEYVLNMQPDLTNGQAVEIGDFVLQPTGQTSGGTFDAFDVIQKDA